MQNLSRNQNVVGDGKWLISKLVQQNTHVHAKAKLSVSVIERNEAGIVQRITKVRRVSEPEDIAMADRSNKLIPSKKQIAKINLETVEIPYPLTLKKLVELLVVAGVQLEKQGKPSGDAEILFTDTSVDFQLLSLYVSDQGMIVMDIIDEAESAMDSYYNTDAVDQATEPEPIPDDETGLDIEVEIYSTGE
jgi:hypothetical protein